MCLLMSLGVCTSQWAYSEDGLGTPKVILDRHVHCSTFDRWLRCSGLSPGCHISCMGSCVVLSFSMVQYTVVCTPSAAASTGLFSVTGF